MARSMIDRSHWPRSTPCGGNAGAMAAAPGSTAGPSGAAGTATPQDGSLDDVAELTHVPRPGVGDQQLARRGTDLAHRLPILGVAESEEVFRQLEHVFTALAQRRHRQDDHRQTEIEIIPEP